LGRGEKKKRNPGGEKGQGEGAQVTASEGGASGKKGRTQPPKEKASQGAERSCNHKKKRKGSALVEKNRVQVQKGGDVDGEKRKEPQS